MIPIVAATIVLLFVVAGEVVSLKSRARVPALLIAMLGLFVVVKIGWVPENVIEASSLAAISAMLTPAIMVHMGTLIPLETIKKQWKAVLIALSGILVSTLLILGIVTPLFSYAEAVAGAGPLSGGIVSTLVTTEGLTAAGITAAAAIPALILMLQALPGMPLTSILLRKYVLRHEGAEVPVGAGASGTHPSGTHPAEEMHAEHETGLAGEGIPDETELVFAPRKKLVRIPQEYIENPFFLLLILLAAGSAAMGLQALTTISYSIWGLLFGVLLCWLGILPDKAMERANAFTIGILGIIAAVTAPLLAASVQQVIDSLLVVLTIIVVGMIGILVGGAIMSKIVGWDMRLGSSVALTAMYGFPADYLISHEVARSIGKDEADRQRILDEILPPMLIGGFTSVSAGSIVIASILVGTL